MLITIFYSGLFHKVISMSGAGPLGQWPLPSNQLEVAKIQAKLVGCPADTSENIVKCLKNVPPEKFNDAVDGFRVCFQDILKNLNKPKISKSLHFTSKIHCFEQK